MGLFWKETYKDIKDEFNKLCGMLKKKYNGLHGLEIEREKKISTKLTEIMLNIHIVLKKSEDIDPKKRKVLEDLKNALNIILNKTKIINFEWAYEANKKL